MSGAQGGKKISSGGIAGTCSHDQRPNSESQIFVLVGDLLTLPFVLAYTGYSYYVFRGKVAEGAGYH